MEHKCAKNQEFKQFQITCASKFKVKNDENDDKTRKFTSLNITKTSLKLQFKRPKTAQRLIYENN